MMCFALQHWWQLNRRIKPHRIWSLDTSSLSSGANSLRRSSPSFLMKTLLSRKCNKNPSRGKPKRQSKTMRMMNLIAMKMNCPQLEKLHLDEEKVSHLINCKYKKMEAWDCQMKCIAKSQSNKTIRWNTHHALKRKRLKKHKFKVLGKLQQVIGLENQLLKVKRLKTSYRLKMKLNLRKWKIRINRTWMLSKKKTLREGTFTWLSSDSTLTFPYTTASKVLLRFSMMSLYSKNQEMSRSISYVRYKSLKCLMRRTK